MRRLPFSLLLVLLAFSPLTLHAASLNIAPASGVFTVGATFTATVSINTAGKSINAFEVFLKFPADKLQIISPSAGPSIASVWVGQPAFDNRTGTVELRGGIPGGITTERGVIATIQFRAKGVGEAFLRISENSKILANDGKGTDILQNLGGAMYRIVLPPPAGPRIVSETHPDQDTWYNASQATFGWEQETGTAGYSYTLSENPVETPDNISEGTRTTVTYQDPKSGNWYFHLKALREGLWGGVSHFEVHVDREPPADFPVDIVSGSHTVQNQPVVQFFTTDALSGIDHFEIKIVPLSHVASAATAEPTDPNGYLFVESQSPYVAPKLELGRYDVIVRAYDKAGNYRSSTRRLEIVEGLGRFFDDKGILATRSSTIPWGWIIVTGALLALAAAFAVLRLKRRHDRLSAAVPENMLSADVKAQLQELKLYRKKYAKPLLLLLAVIASILIGGGRTQAAGPLAPPLITNVSGNISNQDIFYVGGKTLPEAKILLHLQNTETGEIVSEEAASDKKGDWFYRHSGFLRTGEYILWAQAAMGEEVSPPGPQVRVRVETAAVEFGSSRLSYALIYLATTVLLALCIFGLLIVLGRYAKKIKQKQQKLLEDLRMVEERVRRGFAVLRKDIEAELALLNRKDNAALLPQEKFRAEELQKDIEKISERVGEEIWELEKDAAA